MNQLFIEKNKNWYDHGKCHWIWPTVTLSLLRYESNEHLVNTYPHPFGRMLHSTLYFDERPSRFECYYVGCHAEKVKRLLDINAFRKVRTCDGGDKIKCGTKHAYWCRNIRVRVGWDVLNTGVPLQGWIQKNLELFFEPVPRSSLF